MYNIAIISDFHFGVKKDDLFLQSQINFIINQFIPHLKENNIKDIFILGDFYDTRVSVDNKCSNIIYDLFEQYFKDFNVYILIGNHDIYYNNKCDVHSLKFFQKFNNVKVISKISELDLVTETGFPKCKTKQILLVPWQTDKESLQNYIANNNVKAKICLGHLDISGLKINDSTINTFGINPDLLLSNFRIVMSGHYHIRSNIKINDAEIIYVGCPYMLTRNDINDKKGFYTLDLDTLKYEFIENNISIKYKVITYPEKFDKEFVEGNIIDINVNYNNNKEEDILDYIKEVEKLNPAYTPIIKIIEDGVDNVKMDEIKIENMQNLMKEYIEKMNIENKEEVYNSMIELYSECKSIE